MILSLSFPRRLASIGLTVAALSLPLAIGCAGGPSQEELSLLEQKRQAAEAAERQVAELRAEKARLERQLAQKNADLEARQQKQQTVRAAIANWPED